MNTASRRPPPGRVDARAGARRGLRPRGLTACRRVSPRVATLRVAPSRAAARRRGPAVLQRFRAHQILRFRHQRSTRSRRPWRPAALDAQARCPEPCRLCRLFSHESPMISRLARRRSPAHARAPRRPRPRRARCRAGPAGDPTAGRLPFRARRTARVRPLPRQHVRLLRERRVPAGRAAARAGAGLPDRELAHDVRPGWTRYIAALAEAVPERVRVFDYGRSVEGQVMHLVAVSASGASPGSTRSARASHASRTRGRRRARRPTP